MKTVLLVDDTMTALIAVKMILSRQGYQVTTALNGKDALDKLEGGQVVPDIIISDLMMPGIDGIDLCKNIKNNNKLKNIPFLLVTTQINAETQKRAFAAGCDGFLPKPVKAPALLEAMQKQLRR